MRHGGPLAAARPNDAGFSDMGAPAVDPEIAAVLSGSVRLSALSRQALPGLRQQITSRLESLSLSERVTRTDIAVPGPAGQPDVIIRLHTPAGLTGPAPALYSVHGGGYVVGHRAMDDLRFDDWCPELQFVGVSVEYRLAPEAPFPGPLEDCYAGLRWVFEHAPDLGIDPARIGVAGSSAGAGLAAALAIAARDRGGIPVACQLLAYPMIDDRMTTVSSRWDAPVWKPHDNEFGWRCYLGDAYARDEVPFLAAPARAPDLSGLPPALVYVGTADGFCDEDVQYATRLYQAGVPTELHVYPGAPHGFDRSAPESEIGRRCLRDVKEWLAPALGKPR
jgi:acetyl esterase/lipase